MNKFRHLDTDMISFLLFAVGAVAIGFVVCFVPLMRAHTAWTCLDHNYTSAVWTPKHGGMCSRVENGSTVLVKVRDLTAK